MRKPLLPLSFLRLLPHCGLKFDHWCRAAGNGVLANDCLQVFLGGGVFMTALPLAAAAAGAATQTDASQRYSNGGKAASIESVTDGYRRPKRMALMLTVLCVTNTLNYCTRYTHVRAY